MLDLMAYLQCSCGNRDFVDYHRLRTSQAGSVVKEVGGSRCTACGQNADFARLMREADIRQRRAELAAAQKELEEADASKSEVAAKQPA